MRTGGDIKAICGKCGDSWHVVIARTGERIAQVECGECHARHRYRAVAGGSAANAAPARSRASVTTTGGSARRSTSRSRKPARPVVQADPARAPSAFDMRETYRVGDRVVHASFGEGVVQAVVGPKKIEILFDTGAKTLVHARAGI